MRINNIYVVIIIIIIIIFVEIIEENDPKGKEGEKKKRKVSSFLLWITRGSLSETMARGLGGVLSPSNNGF